jgi:hypothetical protein
MRSVDNRIFENIQVLALGQSWEKRKVKSTNRDTTFMTESMTDKLCRSGSPQIRKLTVIWTDLDVLDVVRAGMRINHHHAGEELLRRPIVKRSKSETCVSWQKTRNPCSNLPFSLRLRVTTTLPFRSILPSTTDLRGSAACTFDTHSIIAQKV